MRFEESRQLDALDTCSESWMTIANNAWKLNSQDGSATKERSAVRSSANWLDLDSQTLTMPMDIYSTGTKSSVRPESWVLPIGAHSSDKKKDVPLEQIDKPDAKLPDPWQHPESTKLDGKCGITGVSNMLRLYGVEKAPADIDCSRYRSYGPGLRVDKFASDLRELSGKEFKSCSIDDGSDPLDVLRKHVNEGRPVAIQYMTSPTNAHWVVVTGIAEGKDGTELQVQSWGAYHKVNWRNVQDQWRRGYGGPYPHVVGEESSPSLKKSK